MQSIFSGEKARSVRLVAQQRRKVADLLAFKRNKSVHVLGESSPLPSTQMRTYLLQNDRIIALPMAPKRVSEGALVLRSSKDLNVRQFPSPRLTTLYNALPGVESVKRFADRDAAVSRLWAALDKLPFGKPDRSSKQARLKELMQRPGGANMDELREATGWQAHSVRGAISGVLRKRLKLKVRIESSGNSRVYRIV